MTNYNKKRKRQNGRQKGSPSALQLKYQQGYYDGSSDLITRLIANGILPPVTYDLKTMTIEDFRKDYEQ